jgi:hypothetical protein
MHLQHRVVHVCKLLTMDHGYQYMNSIHLGGISLRGELLVNPMDQISIKTPKPKCRLFIKIDQFF